jgi:carbonic anhydrase
MVDQVVSGIVRFQKDVYPAREALFRELASGQQPDTLLITCADSRIDPSMVTQTEPGELFICRNAGNIVPPHSSHSGGVTSSIEYAVAVLGVKHVVVCGHTDCGAMKGALAPEALVGLPHVSEWLSHARSAVEIVKARNGGAIGDEQLMDLTRENVLQQIQHLRTHPVVAAAMASRGLQLHGWVYEIETGDVYCHDEATGAFTPVAERYAHLIASVKAATEHAHAHSAG